MMLIKIIHDPLEPVWYSGIDFDVIRNGYRSGYGNMDLKDVWYVMESRPDFYLGEGPKMIHNYWPRNKTST